MDKMIKIKVDPLGNPTIEAVGFAGVGCTDATKAIEKALAGGGVTRVLKDDYSAVETEGEEQRVSW